LWEGIEGLKGLCHGATVFTVDLIQLFVAMMIALFELSLMLREMIFVILKMRSSTILRPEATCSA
jgi:hypothetical protein